MASLDLPDDTPIWRYMDLSRFVVLLATNRLWFSKLTELHSGDPYEGYGLAQAGADPRPLLAQKEIQLSPGEVIASIAGFLAAEDINDAASLTYVSSWCWGPESLGMWMLYGADGHGVAVRSTVGRFKNAMKQELRAANYMFGPVNYHADVESFENARYDFTNGTIPVSGNLWQKVLSVGFNKRVAYSYEHEWRAAIYQDRRPEIHGVGVPVDLDGLIDLAYVGPKCTTVEQQAVVSVATGRGLGDKVAVSTLLSAPIRPIVKLGGEPTI